MLKINEINLAVIGLGYVGLPLAVEFSAKRSVTGFDIKDERIAELKKYHDSTGELTDIDLRRGDGVKYTSNPLDLEKCNCFIITVPTPVDKSNRPDLSPLISASEMVGRVLKKDGLVIYESTVYPGATEEDCVPILEKFSGLTCNKDFYVGFSPERINPGDKTRRLKDIMKITSGSTPEAANVIDALYKTIIEAGTYQAKSIKIAEAAKVIENTQRDVNIALINELAIIFNRLGIDTESVLLAAGTKWNFLPFRPGLVGGHCIGIDPYYLKHKSQEVGYHPEIISAVRRLNDDMGNYVVSSFVKGLIDKGIQPNGARILILGLAFKENCSDIRNTRVFDVVQGLRRYGCQVDVYDPFVSHQDALKEFNLDLVTNLDVEGLYDGVLLAVGHSEIKELGIQKIRALGKANHIVYDLKYIFNAEEVDYRI